MTKRGNGEGSASKLPDGRWAAQVSENGKRRRFTGKTRQEVQRKLQEAISLQRSGLPIPDQRVTLDRYLDDWLAGIRRAVRPSTHSTYARHLATHVRPVLGRKTLTKLRAQDVDALYDGMRVRGLSSSTQHHVHVILRMALNQAVDRGLIAKNVTDLVGVPSMVRTEMQTLTVAEAGRVLTAARGERLEALYVLAITAGMRRGELLALHWRDVDLEHRTPSVTGSLSRVNGLGLVVAEPKTRSSRRWIPLTEVAVDALARRRSLQAAERLLVGSEWEDTDLVFTNEAGRCIEPQNMLHRSYEPLLKRAGVRRVRFHDLRHTAAIILAASGVHVKQVSEMLGHATIAITLDLYSHVTPSMGDHAVAVMDAAFNTSNQ